MFAFRCHQDCSPLTSNRLSTQSERFPYLHCHHIGTDKRNLLRHCAVQLECGFRGLCRLLMAVGIHLFVPDLFEELLFFSRLIAFRCHQDCSPLTCNQTVQETCKAQLQSSLEVLLVRTATVLEPTTGSNFDCALFDSRAAFAECAGGHPNTAPQAVCVRYHVRSEVKPRRPPCCTESPPSSCGASLGSCAATFLRVVLHSQDS